MTYIYGASHIAGCNSSRRLGWLPGADEAHLCLYWVLDARCFPRGDFMLVCLKFHSFWRLILGFGILDYFSKVIITVVRVSKKGHFPYPIHSLKLLPHCRIRHRLLHSRHLKLCIWVGIWPFYKYLEWQSMGNDLKDLFWEYLSTPHPMFFWLNKTFDQLE